VATGSSRAGVYALAVSVFVLATSHGGRSTAWTLTSFLLGLGMVLIVPSRSRPRLKIAALTVLGLAIAVSLVGIVAAT